VMVKMNNRLEHAFSLKQGKKIAISLIKEVLEFLESTCCKSQEQIKQSVLS
jgi:hypothetical protein